MPVTVNNDDTEAQVYGFTLDAWKGHEDELADLVDGVAEQNRASADSAERAASLHREYADGAAYTAGLIRERAELIRELVALGAAHADTYPKG